MTRNKEQEEKEQQRPIPEIDEADKKLAETIMKRYNSGVAYKRAQGYYESWPEYERFWNNDQWPAVTEKTVNFPRPSNNQFASIIEQKVSGVTYDPPTLYFEPVDTEILPPRDLIPLKDALGVGAREDEFGEDEEDFTEEEPEVDVITGIDAAEALSHVAKHLWEKLEMDDLIEESAWSAGLLGNGIMFCPWDDTVIGGGKNSVYIGEVSAEVIDPVDFFPGNPYDNRMQTQPYVMLAENLPLDFVREAYREAAGDDIVDALEETTRSDREIYDAQTTEQTEFDSIDIFHCWEKVVKSEGGSLKKAIKYTVVAQDMVLRKEEDMYESGLYPFAHFQWKPRRKSFFGKPESVDLINNQKEENRLAGIALLSAYQNGLPNWVYKPGFVRKEDLPVGPGGEQIPDESPPGHWGVDFIQPPTPAGHIPQLRQVNTENMKDTAGTHEAWSGKAPGARLNASAILALQEAAGIRIRGIQKRLHRMVREIGSIWLGMWKEFYTEERLIRVLGSKGLKGFVWFKGTDYVDMEFEVRVQASPASPFGKSMVTAHLDRALELGVIDVEEYLELIPADVFPMSEKILHKREEVKKDMMEKMDERKGRLVAEFVNQMLQQSNEMGVPLSGEAIEELVRLVRGLAKVESEEELAEIQAMINSYVSHAPGPEEGAPPPPDMGMAPGGMPPGPAGMPQQPPPEGVPGPPPGGPGAGMGPPQPPPGY